MVAGAPTLSRGGLACFSGGHSIKRIIGGGISLRNSIAGIGEDFNWLVDGLGSEAVEGETSIFLRLLLLWSRSDLAFMDKQAAGDRQNVGFGRSVGLLARGLGRGGQHAPDARGTGR